MSDMPGMKEGSCQHGDSPSDIHSLARALRAHRTISSGKRTLLRASDEAELLHAMCTVAVEQGGYARAGVTYAGDGPATCNDSRSMPSRLTNRSYARSIAITAPIRSCTRRSISDIISACMSSPKASRTGRRGRAWPRSAAISRRDFSSPSQCRWRGSATGTPNGAPGRPPAAAVLIFKSAQWDVIRTSHTGLGGCG